MGITGRPTGPALATGPAVGALHTLTTTGRAHRARTAATTGPTKTALAAVTGGPRRRGATKAKTADPGIPAGATGAPDTALATGYARIGAVVGAGPTLTTDAAGAARATLTTNTLMATATTARRPTGPALAAGPAVGALHTLT
ncbi:hypothetical protein BST11_23630, partial [Mycobacterium alsense]